MKYQYMMLDGIRVGLNVDPTCSVDLDINEQKNLHKIVKKLGVKFNEAKKEYFVIKPSKKTDSALHIALRQHNNNESSWYLNISGNPLMHWSGQNVFGAARADLQIKTTFRRCLEWLEKQSNMLVGQSLYDKIGIGSINIHGIEFAVYTRKITGDIDHLISAWQYMYRASNWKQGNKHLSLDKLLSMSSRIDEEEYGSSLAIATMIQDGSNRKRLASLRIYKKLEEIATHGVLNDSVVAESGVLKEEVAADIKDRLRIDLDLSLIWMKRNGVKTIKDLEDYVGTNHAGDWKDFIQKELQKIVKHCALTYMWTFPNIFDESLVESIPKQWFKGIVDAEVKEWARKYKINPSIDYRAHVAMLDARLREHEDGEEVMTSLKNTNAYLERAARTSNLLNTKFTRMQEQAIKMLSFDTGAPDEL